ncbi:unnamed protein product, partial [Discosporangium mesarthrocarpum]
QAAEAEALKKRVVELETAQEAARGEGDEAVALVEAMKASLSAAEAKAKMAEEETGRARADLEAKSELVMQITAQRNSLKHRADSLAKDLSRVCGGGRTIAQIEMIVARYADLKVQMAAMQAEKDSA